MPIQIIRQDITKVRCDAIVNTSNESLIPGGGVDLAIHTAAGPKLLAACEKLNGCELGQAKITPGFSLPCRYVIHTVGPVWRGGDSGERALLESCYTKSLQLAKKYRCRTVAFPLISSGVYSYPKDQVLDVAMRCIGEFLEDHEMTVYIVIYDRTSFALSEKLTSDIVSCIDDRYVEEHEDFFPSCFEERRARKSRAEKTHRTKPAGKSRFDTREDIDFMGAPDAAPDAVPAPSFNRTSVSLEEALGQIDESFSEMLLRKIDESGMKDSECYKKANIDRKLFSKIRSDKHYKPSKPTVLAFAVALELPLDETKDMLMKAGFALSHSNKFDIILEFFIEHGKYDMYEINEALFAFDQPLLGA